MPAPTVEEIQQTKQRIERITREIGELEGRYKAVIDDLARKGFKTLSEAIKILPAEKQKLQALQRQRDELVLKFQQEYQTYLEQHQGRL